MDLKRMKETAVLLDYEIEDSNFMKLIHHVLTRISDAYEEDFPSFSIYEGSAKAGAHVMEDYVIFDIDRLNELCDGDENVEIGIIAHEFAHVYLKHAIAPDDGRGGLKYEDEADKLASKWGFAKEVEIFRLKLGPAKAGNANPVLVCGEERKA